MAFVWHGRFSYIILLVKSMWWRDLFERPLPLCYAFIEGDVVWTAFQRESMMDDLAGIFFLALILIIGIAGYYQKQDNIKRASLKYLNSLTLLMKVPDDESLKQEALALGKEYARITRVGIRNAFFDEEVLINDINAVTAETSTNRTQEKLQSVSRRLIELENLRERGLVSKDEYITKRSSIFDELQD